LVNLQVGQTSGKNIPHLNTQSRVENVICGSIYVLSDCKLGEQVTNPLATINKGIKGENNL
jgi:hypothetical protein